MSQMEEVKRKEMELYQLKKRIAGHESKLKQQQVRASVQQDILSCDDDINIYVFIYLFAPPFLLPLFLPPMQTLYEAVCAERNMCSKNLIEARDEITEMKRKLKIMSHQIDQLKEEIAAKVLC